MEESCFIYEKTIGGERFGRVCGKKATGGILLLIISLHLCVNKFCRFFKKSFFRP